MGDNIAASHAYMAALDSSNAQTNQIAWAAHVVLQIIIGPLTMQIKVGTCCYLPHRLLGPRITLVKDLQLQIADAIDEEFALFSMQMDTSHRCTAFDYEVSCIIGNYLNACVKASATVLLLNPGGKIPVYFQYLQDDLAYCHSVGHPPPPTSGQSSSPSTMRRRRLSGVSRNLRLYPTMVGTMEAST